MKSPRALEALRCTGVAWTSQAVFTGGALGQSDGTVRMLARENAGVVIADVQAEPDAASAREVDGAFVECDVKQEADAQAAVARGRVLSEPTEWRDPSGAEMDRCAA